MARTNQLFALEELQVFFADVRRNVQRRIDRLPPAELAAPDQVIIAKLDEHENFIVGVPHLLRDNLQMEEPVDRKFEASFDSTLDLPDRASRSREIDGKMICAQIPWTGDYRIFSHAPTTEQIPISGYAVVQREVVQIAYFRSLPIDNDLLQKTIQQDLDLIESIVATSAIEIEKFNEEMRQEIPRLIARRRAARSTAD